MNRIKQWIAMFFDSLPYSEETAEARDIIEQALQNTASDAAPDELAAKYGSYEKLAAIGGYTPEDAAGWRSTEALRDRAAIKKELRQQRWRVCLIALLSTFILAELLWTIYNAFSWNPEFFFTLGFGALLFLWAFLVLRKFLRIEKQHSGERINVDTFHFLRNSSDIHAKRLLNSIALFFGALSVYFGSELSFYIFGNSKPAELFENIFSNIILIQKRIGRPEHKRFVRHANGITIFSALYWAAVTAVVILLREYIFYPANAYLFAGILFALLILLYDLTLRKHVTFRNVVFNKPRAALILALLILVGGFAYMSRDTFYTQPYINSLPVVEHGTDRIDYNDETGVYTITSEQDDFKILHLTDIHLGGSLFSYRQDHKALAACYKLIENTHPDLVIVTGDLCFPLGIMSMSFNNSAPVYQFAAFMRNLGIPWAFTYGNHDTESLASMNKEELNHVFMSLSYKTSGTLLYPYTQPEVTGRNNQLIKLRNTEGGLNTGLFLIDSNAYTGEGINVYDFIHDDQVDWYAREVERMNAEAGQPVPSMIFFHIPLQQYRTAFELYEAGSGEVTWFFGENGEKMINKVCCSEYPSRLFDRARDLGCEAMFCGHDHYNNMSLEYEGVRLTYGMSIDYSWDLKQIPLVSIEK